MYNRYTNIRGFNLIGQNIEFATQVYGFEFHNLHIKLNLFIISPDSLTVKYGPEEAGIEVQFLFWT